MAGIEGTNGANHINPYIDNDVKPVSQQNEQSINSTFGNGFSNDTQPNEITLTPDDDKIINSGELGEVEVTGETKKQTKTQKFVKNTLPGLIPVWSTFNTLKTAFNAITEGPKVTKDKENGTRTKTTKHKDPDTGEKYYTSVTTKIDNKKHIIKRENLDSEKNVTTRWYYDNNGTDLTYREDFEYSDKKDLPSNSTVYNKDGYLVEYREFEYTPIQNGAPEEFKEIIEDKSGNKYYLNINYITPEL